MALSQISTVAIPCLVIQYNNSQFIVDGRVEGRVMWVPVRNIFYNEINYWATPVKDSGVFDTLEFYIKEGDNETTPPTFDSFTVFKVIDKISGLSWWIYGEFEDFMASAETCCGEAPVSMPGVGPTGESTFSLLVAPCSIICDTNAAGSNYSVFGLPGLGAGEKYFPYGSYDNVAFTAASGAGYANTTLLLSFLNTNWTNVGSPSASIVWTVSADHLTLTATGGNTGDSICVAVEAFTTSP